MARFVALLRGINVGTAKKVSMPDLSRVFEGLGARNAKTVLRSGNVVFDADQAPDARALEAELKRVTGVSATLMVLDAADFAAIAAANPLDAVATDGSKLFTTFLSEPSPSATAPDAAELEPEQLRLGERAVYQWFPNGSQHSKLAKQFWAQFGGVATARNANTVQKILTLLSEEPENP